MGSYLLLNAQTDKKSKISYDFGITVNTHFSKAKQIDSILKNYAPSVLPGVSIAVYSEAEGWWLTAQGYADLKRKTHMRSNHLQYLQSVSKMYMAVAILQLKEQKKLKLDLPITQYLPTQYSKYIKDAEKITIRMLLNHTSGIPEYNTNPDFLSAVILHPIDNFSPIDCLKSIANEKLLFTPGSKYKYTNTNYLLLALIGNAITKDHATHMKKYIFNPLGLKNSYYSKSNSYLNNLDLPESYWDLLNNGTLVNITDFQKTTVANSKGDDGIVCNTVDAVLFLKGLMEGKLLEPETMKEMMNFVKDEKGHKRYGLGITYFDLGGLPAYGHGGGGIGAGCGLIYIPSHKIYLFISTNLGVFIDGKLAQKADNMKTEILMALLQ